MTAGASRTLAIGMCLAIATAASAQGPVRHSARDPLMQARLNYEALVNGRLQIGNLTPQERADIVELDRQLRARDARPPSQRCVAEELRRGAGHASDLERRVIDMRCRDAGD